MNLSHKSDTIDSNGFAVSVVLGDQPGRFAANVDGPQSGEGKLAIRLSTAEKHCGLLIQQYCEPTASDTSRKRADSRRSATLSHLLELLDRSEEGNPVLHEEHLQHLALLLDCLEVMSSQTDCDRSSLREYVESVQLYSMLPLYLDLTSNDCGFALEDSITLACESVALLDIDKLLESELFELLSEPGFTNRPPCVAIQDALNLKLHHIVDELVKPTLNRTHRRFPKASERLTSVRREGYWSIVKQWRKPTAHLRIPASLSVGQVAWPRVREHWTTLTQRLLRTEESRKSPPTTIAVPEFVEIRSSNDPKLAETLDTQLQRCRERHSSMSLVVVKILVQPGLDQPTSNDDRLMSWQSIVIERLREATDGSTTRGFICAAGELALIVDDMDRGEVTGVLREVLEAASEPQEVVSKMIEVPKIPLVCGVACVTSPSKKFKIDQLTAAAWRCLDAAKSQGPGAVKSLEVF
ncbi:MAG: hypothetical protein SGI77_22965 [Pirellulaceae bacterium]|nr:hypothetical protein [Pirellulaceae bacterium]